VFVTVDYFVIDCFCREKNRQVGRVWCNSYAHKRRDQRRRESCAISWTVYLSAWEPFPFSLWTSSWASQIARCQGGAFLYLYMRRSAVVLSMLQTIVWYSGLQKYYMYTC